MVSGPQWDARTFITSLLTVLYCIGALVRFSDFYKFTITIYNVHLNPGVLRDALIFITYLSFKVDQIHCLVHSLQMVVLNRNKKFQDLGTIVEFFHFVYFKWFEMWLVHLYIIKQYWEPLSHFSASIEIMWKLISIDFDKILYKHVLQSLNHIQLDKHVI